MQKSKLLLGGSLATFLLAGLVAACGGSLLDQWEAPIKVQVNGVTVEQCENPKKVLICHVPPGNPANAHSICVGKPAERAHVENHGDAVGACAVEPGGEDPGSDAGTPGGEDAGTGDPADAGDPPSPCSDGRPVCGDTCCGEAQVCVNNACSPAENPE